MPIGGTTKSRERNDFNPKRNENKTQTQSEKNDNFPPKKIGSKEKIVKKRAIMVQS